MNTRTLIVAASLCAGLLIVAVLAFAGSFSSPSVAPTCGEVGNFWYEVTYCCDPGEGAPNCVLVTVYKQGYYLTSAIMDVIALREVCHTYGQWITLDDTGNDYSYNFRICGGTPIPNLPGPCVVEDKDEDCPCPTPTPSP